MTKFVISASGRLLLRLAHLVELVVERLQADAQFFGAPGLVAFVALERLLDY